MKKRLPFTVRNVISSFSEVTGIPPAQLSVEEKVGRSTKFCTVYVESPVLGDRNFTAGVTIYRDQETLDECSASELPYDELNSEFYDVGDLSPEDVVRHAAKGCRLSDLRHWVISEGRNQRLSDAEIKAQLERPLEFLIERYRDADMEGAFLTLVCQCRSDEMKMARHLVKAAGGAQKIWKEEFFEELPGGFIMRLIPDEDASLFQDLVKRVREKGD